MIPGVCNQTRLVALSALLCEPLRGVSERAMRSLLDKGFSKLTVDIATLSVVMLFLDEVRIRISNFRSHRLYLNAVLGMGSGASIALLIV